jgi:hypothetical protein
VLTYNQNGQVKIEQDINTLHTFTASKSNVFRKNRVLRTLDEIEVTTRDMWETSYLGKVTNNEDGRGVFKNDLLGYFTLLENMGAITDFDGPADIRVERGADLDAVMLEADVRPTDSMEKLYAAVRIIL